MKKSSGYATYLAMTAALGGFLFGFDSAVINGAVGGLSTAFGASSAGTGFAVASILLGCALGALIAGRVADALGRKPVMLATAVVFAATAVWAGLAGTAVTFTIARFLSGIGVGAASVVCPAYIAEISPPHVRGRLASLQQLGIVVGIFAALLSDDLIARVAGGPAELAWAGLPAWRWMFLVEVVPSIAFAVAAFSIPESPRFLVARKRDVEAGVILERINGGDAGPELEAIRATVVRERVPRLADLRGAGGKILAIVWVGAGLSVLQQLVGINSIFYYSAMLWETVGFTTADSLRIGVVTGVVNIVSTLVAMAFVDRVGRKPLLLAGSIGMSVTLGVLALVFALADVDASGKIALSHGAGLAALVAANLYVFAFGVSWGPCVWILLGEMFPNSIRGAAMAVAVFGQWIANWLVTLSFPPTVAALGPAGAYGTYFAFAALSFFFVRRWVTETRGLALEAMTGNP